ncbi:RDD family protein [Lewinella sp. LCG006]|uniref:RDD family protein n=1 Tax=Lewinella sp. LCG006 TaxID=3231911 RepID=UPI0034613E03
MQTIDLKTTQNVTIEYELATLGERMLAVIVDLIVVGIAYFLLAAIVTAAFNATWSGMQAGIFGFVLPLACFLVYNFLFELLSHGQSLGKRALSIQVVRLDGEEPAPADYLLRALFYFVDLMATAGILGGLLISSSPKRQRLGDMTAGTSVIKMNASNRFGLGDILRISSLEDYEPRYPQVRQFSEEDMLLIKNTIARYQRYPNSANRNILQDLAAQLGLQLDAPREETRNAAEFLKTLIRDYIVLTR